MFEDIDDETDDTLEHYGILRRSGRYPWGSGSESGQKQYGDGPNETKYERAVTFIGQLEALRKGTNGGKGFTDLEIATGFGMTTSELRSTITIANNTKKLEHIATARAMKADGKTNTEIAVAIYGSKSKESNVRGLLAPGVDVKAAQLQNTVDALRTRVEETGYLDVGRGTNHLVNGGIPKKLMTDAVAVLKTEGYEVRQIFDPQVGTGNDTRIRVLTKEDWATTMKNSDKIKLFTDFMDRGDLGPKAIQDPIAIDPERLQVVTGKDGGGKADGIIYVRPGVPDLDMGSNLYAQTRIQIGDKHYLKGMAVIKKDLPDGVDLQFNTPKEHKGDKLTLLKPLKGLKEDENGNLTGTVDKDLPFGSIIQRQIHENGKNKSAINIVNEDDNWDSWTKSGASQFLSKQPTALIKEQLSVTYANKKAQLDEIMELTNPVVKRRMLETYADSMDSSAVHMKAASMPRQETKVIIPINSLKDNEVYAPTMRDGERVVAIRYPHAGTFEIPELIVNNRNREGAATISKNSIAAIGINHKVAERLSGADFDGDSVVLIPNPRGRIKSSPPLEGLKGFDPQSAYGKDAWPGGYPIMHKDRTGMFMGKASNLITDMTILGATSDEIARAARHSMVVIDAAKHKLNYRQSEIDNGIAALRKKYQPAGPGSRAGAAATIVSRSTGPKEVLEFKPRPVSDGGSIDPKTGRVVNVLTGRTKSVRTVDKVTGEESWSEAPRTMKVKRGSLVDDAHELKSGSNPVENAYADYSNSVRALANKARLEILDLPKFVYSPPAAKLYKTEVDSLNAKLRTIEQRAPLERQAQIQAKSIVKIKRTNQPDMDSEDIKKASRQALKSTRERLGLTKLDIQISEREWTAIQAGAISGTRLKQILEKSNMEQVKKLATPKQPILMSSSKIMRAKGLLGGKYTMAEVADELGVSLSTLKKALV